MMDDLQNFRWQETLRLEVLPRRSGCFHGLPHNPQDGRQWQPRSIAEVSDLIGFDSFETATSTEGKR